jgi:hypothetical protein
MLHQLVLAESFMEDITNNHLDALRLHNINYLSTKVGDMWTTRTTVVDQFMTRE